MGDASPFCAHFVQLDAEYTCSRYGRACCRSCGFVKFNSLFARSAKNDPSILKARSRIDSVMVKVADPNSLIDLRKDFLHTVDESVQLENAGISDCFIAKFGWTLQKWVKNIDVNGHLGALGLHITLCMHAAKSPKGF